jgi:hypothetical protein
MAFLEDMICLMSDSTEVGAAANPTEQIAVDYPETPLAWSQVEDHWSMPRQRRVAWYVLPALVAAGVAFMLLSRPDVVVTPPAVTQPATQPAATTQPTLPPPPIPIDDQFISTMAQSHFVVADPAAMIHSAHIICANMLDGATKDDASQHVYEAMKDSGYGYEDAIRYVNISIQFYCPRISR